MRRDSACPSGTCTSQPDLGLTKVEVVVVCCWHWNFALRRWLWWRKLEYAGRFFLLCSGSRLQVDGYRFPLKPKRQQFYPVHILLPDPF